MAGVDLNTTAGVATMTLGDGETLTTLSPTMATEMARALDAIEADASLRCVVIAGTGRAFAVGADAKELHDLPVADALEYNERLIDAIGRIDALPVPVVAAVNGFALGGGLELALACTTRVASENAVLGVPEVTLGILPGAGGTPRLPRLVGHGAAMRMLLTGAKVGAAEALRIGLVDSVAPPDEVDDQAQALARAIAANAPLAVRAIVAAERETRALAVDEATRAIHERLGQLLATADAREGMAAFLEKRPPNFTGA